jgi:hypothetical protein
MPQGHGERSLSFCLETYCERVDASVEVMVMTLSP